MKIAIDASYAALADSQKAGVYNYILNLILELNKIAKENEYILFFNFFSRRHFRTYKEFCSLLKGLNFQRKLFRFPSVIWRNSPLPVDLLIGRVDVFHGPFDYIPPLLFGKSIVTIHDLRFLRTPKFIKKKWVQHVSKEIPLSAKRADLIITASNNSKNDIMELLGVSEDKIRIIYHGVSSYFVPVEEEEEIEKVKNKYEIPEKYILFVGTLQPGKNIEGLIEAFNILKNSYSFPHKLVIAGTKGWLYKDIFQRVKELKLEENIVFTGFFPEEELPALYSGAELFVYPSFIEGFGIPVLESMACGTPVVSSNSTCLPEVVGNAGVIVNPHSAEDIAEGIYKVLSDSSLRKELIEEGFKRSKEFTWERTAKMTLDVYREVCKY